MHPTPGSHGSTRRDSDLYRRESFPDEGTEGRFGRLFAVGEGGTDRRGTPKLRPHASPRYDLERLGDPCGPLAGTGPSDGAAPAGITFLGQFVDHDMTLDTQSTFERPQLDAGLENGRTPNLDLDCVYGGGPEASPHLYAPPYLLEGEDVAPADAARTSDLPRNAAGRALIGDPRNDENIIVAQVQSAFIRFHNRVVDVLKRAGESDEEVLLDRARDTTTHYYHRAVLEDLLYHVVGIEMIRDIATRGRRFYFPEGFRHHAKAKRKSGRPLGRPFMPVEFSVAAYRYGHSQVRDTYRMNAGTTLPLFAPRGAGARGDSMLRGFQPLPEGHAADWDEFFPHPGQLRQAAFRIDPFLPAPLMTLPENVVAHGVTSLATRNLLRGRTFRLPAGEALAERMAEHDALVGAKDLDCGPIVRIADAGKYPDDVAAVLRTLGSSFAMTDTPLWLYVLLEAAVHGDGFVTGTSGSGGGDRLGPVGGRLVAEVVMGLLDHFRDMSGKGLDHDPAIATYVDGEGDGNRIRLIETANFGPRLAFRSMIDFAYAAPLDEPEKAKGR